MMTKKLIFEDGSFRDPTARVAYFEDSILRVVKSKGFKQFKFIKKILENTSISNYIVDTKEIRYDELNLNSSVSFFLFPKSALTPSFKNIPNFFQNRLYLSTSESATD